ncbi:MAG: DotU family type IV/VI secretion system protein [Deltaproteobacteria bacterium]|jgi:hypothetical protein|nr:DotU family type IV/VI secretion system protein [Deltaproteobacteria bacterium]
MTFAQRYFDLINLVLNLIPQALSSDSRPELSAKTPLRENPEGDYLEDPLSWPEPQAAQWPTPIPKAPWPSPTRSDLDLGQIAQLLELELEKEGRRPLGSISPREAKSARLALLCWVDERILTSNLAERNLWVNHSLVRRETGALNGGDLFFEELARLLALRANRLNPLQSDRSAGQLAEVSRDSLWGAPLSLTVNGSWESPALGPALAGQARDLFERWPEAEEASWPTLDPTLADLAKETQSPNAAGPLLSKELRDLNLKHLARIWSGAPGPQSLEETLECYALALLLGFRGRLATKGQEGAQAALLAVAAEKITAAHPLIQETAAPADQPKPAFWGGQAAYLWHGLLPALLTALVFWRGLMIIESLP